MKCIKRLKVIFLFFAMLILFAILCQIKVNADDITLSPITGFQVEFSGNQVNLHWTKSNTCDGYELQFTKDSTFMTDIETVMLKNNSITSYSIKNKIIPDETYFFRIRSYVNSAPMEYSEWSDTKYLSYTLDVPSIAVASIEENIVNVMWWGCSYIDGYELQYSTNSDFSSIQNSILIENDGYVIDYTFKNTSLSPNTEYFFRVRSYAIFDSSRQYSKWSTVKTDSYKMEIPSSIQTTTDGRSIKISWNQTPAPQYILEISPDQSFDQTVTYKTSTNQFETQVHLKAYENYYIRIKADNPGVGQSEWSSMKTIQYTLTQNNFKDTMLEGNNILLNWNSAYDGCEIQYSNDDDFEVATTINKQSNETECKIEEQPPGIYYFRMRHYETVDALFYGPCVNYTPWSSIVSIQIKPQSPVLNTATLSSNRVDFNFTTIEGVDGYEVQYSTSTELNDAQLIQYVDGSGNDFAYRSFFPSQKYYFRIRSYISVQYGKVYSEWSEFHETSYTLQKTYIKTQTISNGNIVINWKTLNDCDKYQICYGNDPDLLNGHIYDVQNAQSESWTISDTIPGTWYFKIRTVATVNGVDYYSDWSNTKNITLKVNKTYIKTLSIDNSKIKIDWNNIDGCHGYQIQYAMTPELDQSTIIEINDPSTYLYYLENIIPGIYYVRIRTYITPNDMICYSDWSNIKLINYKIEKTYFTNQYSENNVLHLTWKKSNCDIYSIQYSQTSDFASYRTAVFANKSSEEKISNVIDDHDLMPGKYYLRIRTAHKINGKYYYSEWSNTKTVDYKINKTYIKTLVSVDNRIDINWKTMENCDGYQIEYSLKEDMNESVVVLIPDCEFDQYSMGYQMPPGKYYVRIRAYKNIDSVNYYSEWSNIKTVNYDLVKTYFTNQYVHDDKIHLTWKPVNCDGYEIRLSANPEFTNSQSFIVNGGAINKFKNVDAIIGNCYLQIRTFKTIESAQYFSAWSNAKVIYYGSGL